MAFKGLNVIILEVLSTYFQILSGQEWMVHHFAEKCLHDAGVAIIPGISFGKSAKNYVRFSFANSYENIEKALEKIKKIV